MLELINVRKTFNRGTVNEKPALNGVNLHLKDGDFVTIIGGNGAGKSTTLNMIAGVYPIDQGKVVLNGENLTHMPEHRRARYLGRVFQDPIRERQPGWRSRRIWRWLCAGAKEEGWAGASRKRNRQFIRRRWRLWDWGWRSV